MIIYLNGKYIPRDQAMVSVDDRGFLFGDGIYEVVTIYQGYPFLIDEHLKRLSDGLRALSIQGVDTALFPDVCQRLLSENDLTDNDGVLYMQVTRGEAPRLHAFPSENVPPTIFMAANPLHPSARFDDKTISAILVPDVRWARCDIKSISLIANVLARQRAIDAGVREAIFVRNGVVMEGTASTLFATFDGEVFTHPKTNYLLPGVTRDVVLSLCAEQDIPVNTVPILEQDIPLAEEIFVTSTTMEIVPVVELDHRPVAGGTPGPITLKLKQAFQDMVFEFLRQRKQE